jgi:nicotinamide mononucleotide (NMN) deamidase PncC
MNGTDKHCALLLPALQVTVAVAEGASGGRIGERLVRYPGGEVFFKGSVVTYDYHNCT